MEINVKGVANKYYIPDEVVITLNFYTRRNSYEDALNDGIKDVDFFISNVFEKLNFNKSELKTKNFKVYEETKYDYEKNQNIKLGFAYSQNASFKFDYNMDIISKFMELIACLPNPPKYIINFGVKEEEKIKNEILGEAYVKAKEKAEAIALASGKKVKDCIKTSFESFDSRFFSNSSITENVCFMKKDKGNNIISNIFTPEDIKISETLYCLFIAE